MDTTLLLTTVLGGLVGGRGKRAGRATRYLTGGRGGFLSNPAMLMTAAGLAWGVYESLQQSTSAQSRPASGATPPLPAPSVTPDASAQSPGSAAIRLIRVAVSAANADGAVNERERAAILQRATAAGVPEAVAAQLSQPQPLAEVVKGVESPEEAATLYVLAFTVLRADEQVTGAERIYLAQLAHLLRLDQTTVQALESNTAERIDALGDQGQLGG
jgi:uncharacterized membrane protein YebE (DUF533 family)